MDLLAVTSVDFGLWVYALSFRREVLSVLDRAFVAAECFPPRRRRAVLSARKRDKPK